MAAWIRTVSQPDLIDFGIGQPHESLLWTIADIQECLSFRASEVENNAYDIRHMLQYGSLDGEPELRESLSAWLNSQREDAFDFEPEEFIITNGSSHGLDLCCRHLVSQGKTRGTILVQEFSYFLAQQVVLQGGFDRVVTVPDYAASAGEQDIELFLQAWQVVLEAEREHISAVYVVPTFGNPTGYTWPTELRMRFLDLVARFVPDCTIISDDVYAQLPLCGNSTASLPPYLSQLWKNPSYVEGAYTRLLNFLRWESLQVVTISSFAKLLGPGLKVGYIHCPVLGLKEKLLTSGVMCSGGGANPFVGSILSCGLKVGLVQTHIEHVREELSRRATCMIDLAISLLGHCCEIDPYAKDNCGGYFLWLKLPHGGMGVEGCDAIGHEDIELSALALRELAKNVDAGVSFLPGPVCVVGNYLDFDRCVGSIERSQADSYIRLCWAFYDVHAIQNGMKRLALLLHTFMNGPEKPIEIDPSVLVRIQKHYGDAAPVHIVTAAEIESFNRNGYIIFRNFFSHDTCDTLKKEVLTRFGMDENDPSKASDAVDKYGFVDMWHSPTMYELRQDSRLFSVFAQLLGTTDLYVSLDRCAVKPPDPEAYKTRTESYANEKYDVCDLPSTDSIQLPTHHDMNIWKWPEKPQLQSGLCLENCPQGMGGFFCVPEFHRDYMRLAYMQQREEPPEPGGVPKPHRLRDETLIRELGREIPLHKGDLILWHGGLPHGNLHCSLPAQYRWRLQTFVRYFPATAENEFYRQHTRECVRNGWKPVCYSTLNHTDNKRGDVDIPDYKMPTLSKLGRKVLSMDVASGE